MWRCNGGFLLPFPVSSAPSAALSCQQLSIFTSLVSRRAYRPVTRSFSTAVASSALRPCSIRSSFSRRSRPCCSLRMASTLPKLPLFDAILRHDPDSTAVTHCLSGRSFRYGELLPDVARVREQIYAAAGKSDIRGERVAFLVENSYDYVGMELGDPLVALNGWLT